MERDKEKRLVLVASVLSGTLFSIPTLLSFSILRSVNRRPWRIYRFDFLLFPFPCRVV
uniref:Uncharacterized protein n=1 Tax=Nelumbo nucifera TaxID=4432 RepID=A0A822YCU7_NELNU|nr:TPA_asm: hypothetical protein HUJ06_031620 [Nelumbo nucifera]